MAIIKYIEMGIKHIFHHLAGCYIYFLLFFKIKNEQLLAHLSSGKVNGFMHYLNHLTFGKVKTIVSFTVVFDSLKK